MTGEPPRGLDDILARLAAADWPIHTGAREVFVQDPDGYLIMMSQALGERR
ncbi:MAG: hypothetical protein RIM84_19655 [Alphaproteobacteria bacterium]